MKCESNDRPKSKSSGFTSCKKMSLSMKHLIREDGRIQGCGAASLSDHAANALRDESSHLDAGRQNVKEDADHKLSAGEALVHSAPHHTPA